MDALRREHPEERLLLLGVGDVTLPLAPAVIAALHRAAEDQAKQESFQGYMPELGKDFMKQAVADYYARRGTKLDPAEIFISYGAGDDLGVIGGLFAQENRVAVIEPAYPAYVDTNLMAGRTIVSVPGGEDNGFLPLPPEDLEAELVYLCSPNNPTGAAYTRAQLQQWVDWANARDAVILFDAAYEAFITDPAIPHSIYELPGAERCAIEIASLSKTAGFTGTRLGWTVVPRALIHHLLQRRVLPAPAGRRGGPEPGGPCPEREKYPGLPGQREDSDRCPGGAGPALHRRQKRPLRLVPLPQGHAGLGLLRLSD